MYRNHMTAIALATYALSGLVSPTGNAQEHPRSYYPTLTRADISPCRPQLETLKGSVVAHYRAKISKESQKPTSFSDRNIGIYTGLLNKVASQDPVDMYVEGEGGGEGDAFGNLAVANQIMDEATVEMYQRYVEGPPQAASPQNLVYDLYDTSALLNSEKCIGRIYLDKFYALHPERRPGYQAAADAPSVATSQNSAPSSTPASLETQWKQQGKDARIIASDGKSAMDCVKLIEVSKGDAKLSGLGSRVLSNQCSGPVEIGWCYSPGDCDTETGSSWTVQAGRSWPVSAEKPIRWAACHGANTTSFVKGSHGLRYYCKAPAKT